MAEQSSKANDGINNENGRRSLAGGRRLALAAAAVALMAAWMVTGPAGAETITVPIDQVAAKGEPGSTIRIGQADVSDDLVGRSCDITVVVTNQESAHPGNKLIVASGDSSLTIDGIEDEPGGITTQAGTITLGSTITVSVQLGTANITSLGSNLTVTCDPLPVTKPASTIVTTPVYSG
jgi:hypothetical protein